MTRFRLIAAAPLLLLLPAGASASQHWDHSFPAGKHPKVVITGSDAHIRVHAATGTTVEASVTAKGQTVGIYFQSRKPEVSFDQKGEVIEIVARSGGEERKSGTGIMITWLTLVVDVTVPPGCDLEIENDDGPVQVSGIEGRVEVRNSDGDVHLSDLRGDIRVRTSDGPVVAENLDGRLQGHTADGTMRVSGRFDELDLESQDGRLTVDIQPGSQIREAWNLTTQDGGLDLGIPGALKATLDARVEDGGMRIDLPKVEVGDSHPSGVRIDLNGGGPVLRVRSADGSVRIRTHS
jgi:hypothetical protein